MLGCLAAVGLAIPATAAAKVTSLTSCQPITAPGKYRLDADVTGAPAEDCFDISAGGVTLNLNGHTLTGGQPGGFGIFVPREAANVNVVGPGTLTGWEIGIDGPGNNGSVRGVTATRNDFGVAINNFVAGASIRGNVATTPRLASRSAAGPPITQLSATWPTRTAILTSPTATTTATATCGEATTSELPTSPASTKS